MQLVTFEWRHFGVHAFLPDISPVLFLQSVAGPERGGSQFVQRLIVCLQADPLRSAS